MATRGRSIALSDKHVEDLDDLCKKIGKSRSTTVRCLIGLGKKLKSENRISEILEHYVFLPQGRSKKISKTITTAKG